MTDVDKASCYSTRTCTKIQSSFIAMWACCRTLAPCGCAGGVGSLIRPPLAEQLWERVVEELITGPAGQSHCQSQLLVNKPAKNREGKKKNRVQGEVCSSAYLELCVLTHAKFIQDSIMWYNEAFRCRSTASGEWALRICRHPTVFVCFTNGFLISAVVCRQNFMVLIKNACRAHCMLCFSSFE